MKPLLWLICIAILGSMIYVLRSSLLKWYEKTAIFLKEVRVEMQKVVWPSKQEVYGATFVVLVSVVILTVAIGFEDLILTKLLDLILRLAPG